MCGAEKEWSRLLIVVVSTEHGKGHGAEVVLEHLLRAWDVADLPLTILAPPESGVAAAARENNHRLVPLLSRRDSIAQNVASTMRASSQIAGERLVHAWHARGYELALLLSRRFGFAATGTLHDHPQARFHGHARRLVMRYCSQRLGGLVCVSQALADACREISFGSHLHVIRNGISDLASIPCAARRDREPLRIGFGGMYAERKGFRIVEKWIRQCPASGVQWRLYGENVSIARRAAEKLVEDFPGRVLLLGRQSTETIFSEIDILVHPSVEFDPYPTMLIEAARSGVPCVATGCGGTPEIVKHLETGFVFPTAESATGFLYLRRLFEDSALRMTMGSASRRRFETTFKLPFMISMYADFWRACVHGKGGTACR